MAEVYPKKITTTFSVSFSIQFDGLLKGEVDDREEDDGGKNKTTSFLPGDPVWCLVYTGPGVEIIDTIVSHGSFNPPALCGGVYVKKAESITFQSPDGLTQTLGYPIKPGTKPVVKFIGTRSMANDFDENSNTITAVTTKKYDIAVAEVTYEANASEVLLTHVKIPNTYEYEIAILMVGDFTPIGYGT